MATGPARQIGNVTAVFMIFNQMIGTDCVPPTDEGPCIHASWVYRVFATSTILGFSGSVDLVL